MVDGNGFGFLKGIFKKGKVINLIQEWIERYKNEYKNKIIYW